VSIPRKEKRREGRRKKKNLVIDEEVSSALCGRGSKNVICCIAHNCRLSALPH